ncbi:MAG: hypothetical protein ACREBO_11515, partial [Novosphingobium sp.]
VLAMLPALPLTLLGLAAPLRAAPSAQPLIAPPPRASTCRIPDAAPALRALPTGNVLAPLDIGPRLLLETEHGVVATGHHRAATAMRAVIDAFTGSPERAREIAAAYRIDYVAFCGDLAEPAIYAEAAPHGFAAQLRGGRTPDWLEPVAMPAGVNLKVWKVLR